MFCVKVQPRADAHKYKLGDCEGKWEAGTPSILYSVKLARAEGQNFLEFIPSLVNPDGYTATQSKKAKLDILSVLKEGCTAWTHISLNQFLIMMFPTQICNFQHSE